ncbi:hypothetical protein ACH4E5_41525 [Streptomyces afghaniensis]|uniref:hypothetical protein n=1 Tax=Streptomyces afghaniensis TaxID=66865 RepID=UPI0037B1DD65
MSETWVNASEPGTKKAAEQAVEVASHLADPAGADGWSTAAAEDVLDATDILTDTLGGTGTELAQTLAVMPAGHHQRASA